MPVHLTKLPSRLLLLKMRGIEQHEPDKLKRRRCPNHRAAESPADEKRQPSAVVEMGMRQQYAIDRLGIEPERVGILLGQLAAALEQAAVDENAAPQALEHMTGAGNASVGAMKG
ncbi:MAG TPA: hypothetical protein VGU20_09060 [Stellaceae bacterium]|nr:hypothetical protein [Stellaceae bacterium]